MNGALRWGILEALLHLYQQMSNMVQRRFLTFINAQYICLSDWSPPMDIDADHLTSHPDSTCPAAPSIPTDMDVDPAIPGDRTLQCALPVGHSPI
jgi:hypothetical protein